MIRTHQWKSSLSQSCFPFKTSLYTCFDFVLGNEKITWEMVGIIIFLPLFQSAQNVIKVCSLRLYKQRESKRQTSFFLSVSFLFFSLHGIHSWKIFPQYVLFMAGKLGCMANKRILQVEIQHLLIMRYQYYSKVLCLCIYNPRMLVHE